MDNDLPTNFSSEKASLLLKSLDVDRYTEKCNRVEVKKEIGLFRAVNFIVGSMVGSGIFLAPPGILRNAGSLGMTLVVWLCCGVISVIGGLCYCEFGTTIPQSGSDYTYLLMCFGHFPAFLHMYVSTLVGHGTSKVVHALTFGNYVLQPIFSSCEIPPTVLRIVSVLVICFLTYINCRQVSWAARVQVLFTLAKITALIVIIVAGSYHMLTGHTENFENAFEGTIKEPGYIALAFYSSIYCYSGWNILNCFTEELKEPNKNLPRAVYIAVPLVTFIYISVNIAYFAVLSSEEILSSNAVALVFAERTLGIMAWIMPISVALSTFGGLNGGIFASARMLFAGAREGHLPGFISMIHIDYFTPVPSLVFLSILSLFYLSTIDVFVLINYTIFVDSFFLTLSVAGMIFLRFKRPDLERPIKMPIILLLTYLIICIFLFVLPLYNSSWETCMGVAIVLTGVPVYFLTVFWENKPKLYAKAIRNFNLCVQKLLLSVPEEKNE